MNRERTKELLPVYKHFADGGDVQVRRTATNSNWCDNGDPSWNPYYEYRIKSKPREFWICTTKGSHSHYYNCVDHKPVNTNYIKVREIIE